jgi:SnoaL-like domain
LRDHRLRRDRRRRPEVGQARPSPSISPRYVAGVTEHDIHALEARLRAVEDELAIRRLILSYGPAADAAMADRAAAVWLEDGVYDWDPKGEPHVGRDAMAAMLRSDQHLRLVGNGVAHMAGPPLIDVDGDRATALTYSLILRRDVEAGRYFLWRLSAARWDLEREDGSWGVRRRTHRLLDESGAGRDLFGDAMRAMFDEADR